MGPIKKSISYILRKCKLKKKKEVFSSTREQTSTASGPGASVETGGLTSRSGFSASDRFLTFGGEGSSSRSSLFREDRRRSFAGREADTTNFLRTLNLKDEWSSPSLYERSHSFHREGSSFLAPRRSCAGVEVEGSSSLMRTLSFGRFGVSSRNIHGGIATESPPKGNQDSAGRKKNIKKGSQNLKSPRRDSQNFGSRAPLSDSRLPPKNPLANKRNPPYWCIQPGCDCEGIMFEEEEGLEAHYRRKHPNLHHRDQCHNKFSTEEERDAHADDRKHPTKRGYPKEWLKAALRNPPDEGVFKSFWLVKYNGGRGYFKGRYGVAPGY